MFGLIKTSGIYSQSGPKLCFEIVSEPESEVDIRISDSENQTKRNPILVKNKVGRNRSTYFTGSRSLSHGYFPELVYPFGHLYPHNAWTNLLSA